MVHKSMKYLCKGNNKQLVCASSSRLFGNPLVQLSTEEEVIPKPIEVSTIETIKYSVRKKTRRHLHFMQYGVLECRFSLRSKDFYSLKWFYPHFKNHIMFSMFKN